MPVISCKTRSSGPSTAGSKLPPPRTPNAGCSSSCHTSTSIVIVEIGGVPRSLSTRRRYLRSPSAPLRQTRCGTPSNTKTSGAAWHDWIRGFVPRSSCTKSRGYLSPIPRVGCASRSEPQEHASSERDAVCARCSATPVSLLGSEFPVSRSAITSVVDGHQRRGCPSIPGLRSLDDSAPAIELKAN